MMNTRPRSQRAAALRDQALAEPAPKASLWERELHTTLCCNMVQGIFMEQKLTLMPRLLRAGGYARHPPPALGGSNPEGASWRPPGSISRPVSFVWQCGVFKSALSITIQTQLMPPMSSLQFCAINTHARLQVWGRSIELAEPRTPPYAWVAKGRDKQEFHNGSGSLHPWVTLYDCAPHKGRLKEVSGD